MILLKKSITKSILWVIIGALFFNIIEGLSRIFLADNTGKIVNTVAGQASGQFSMLIILGIIYSMVLMVSIYIKEACYARGLEKTLANIRMGLFDRIIAIDYGWMKNNNTNELVAGISNDLNALTDALRPWVVMNFSQMILRVISTIYLLSVNWFLTFILLSIIPIFTWFQKQLIKPLRKYSKENQIIMGRLTATAGFCFQQRELMKAMALENAMLSRFKQEQKLQYQISKKERIAKAISHSLGMTTRVFTILLLFGVGTYLVMGGRISIGELFAFYSLAYGVIHLPSGLAQLIADGQKLLVCIERINEVYNLPIEEDFLVNDNSLPSNPQAVLEFQKVSFSYEGRHKILQDISFEINRGETVLLTGENGSGKSTIFTLIAGFYKLTSGNIYLSGVNIHSIPKKVLRSRICFIPQEPILFFGTVFENVTCFRQDIQKEYVVDILKKLDMEETLNRMPRGLDSQVGEMGSMLSGGERQRILIARCFISKADIIILDEAAAGLEEEKEDRILGLLKELPHKPAIFYISHNKKAGKEADRILYLKNGKISDITPKDKNEGVANYE